MATRERLDQRPSSPEGGEGEGSPGSERRAEEGGEEDLSTPLQREIGDERFELVIVDPPWRYENYRDVKHGAPKYQTESVEEIARLVPVGEVLAKDAVVLCWTTGVGLAEGWHLPLFESWGLRAVTLPFVWIKTEADGVKPKCGLGRYTRSSTEFVILGVKGKGLKRCAADIPQVFSAPAGSHSAKPEGFHRLAEKLFGTNRKALEVFARRQRPGWRVFGNETNEEEHAKQLEMDFGERETSSSPSS